VNWERVRRNDRHACALADRHYSRQVVGVDQVGGNARLVVLMTPDRRALWISEWSAHVLHEWPLSCKCALFRNERPRRLEDPDGYLSSDLIREAVAVTRYIWGEPPADGFITFVDDKKTRRKRDPGRCFVKAGWTRLPTRTKRRGYVVLQLEPAGFQEPVAPLGHLPLEASV
jgi:hypothetical protein